MQTAPPRDIAPSPPFRDARRAIKTQSMPLVPTVMQKLSNQNIPQSQSQNQPAQPSPTTTMPPSRRSPPPAGQQQPAPATNLSSPTHQSQASPHITPPPHKQQSGTTHNPQIGYPRPIPRVPAPPFLKSFHGVDEKWHVTPELLAEIERADLEQHAPGTSGVAYAGGAGGYTAHVEPESPPKDPVIDRMRINERSSPKESEPRRQQSSVTRKPTSPHTPERRESPAFRAPHGSTAEHPSSNYPQHKRESYQRAPTPPASRRPSNAADNPTAANKQTPPQGRKPTPDRSLPVQEAEDDQVEPNRRASPTPPSETHSDARTQRQDSGRDSRVAFRTDESTLYEPDSNSDEHSHMRGQEDDEEAYSTPRSPAIELQEHPRDSLQQSFNGGVRQHPAVRAKARSGPSDQIGMRSIDPAIFEPPIRQKDYGQAPRHLPLHQQYQPPPQYVDGYLSEQNTSHSQWQEEVVDPAIASYIQSYLRSPRPGAPIPPTPHSQTAAPSPSPMISGSEWGHKDPPLPVGSPHPYPFSHVPRTHTYSATPNFTQASSNHGANTPYTIQEIQEQLALQWEMYVRNNHGDISDSTLSPSASPSHPPGYNPWVFFNAARSLGNRRMEHSMSLQSSPSHEPIALPPLPTRDPGSLKRRGRSINLRKHAGRVKVQPPPRVESTQPRETSPEPSSSGEETAGDDQYQHNEEGNWAEEDDGADWILEDAEPEEDDLLELEYHPTFVNNIEKRRRRWETRWEALVQAFQALDRQTDATVVLMASPSHTTKLHMISSRSIRRGPDLHGSPAMAAMRSSFRHVASRRRAARSRKSLAEQLMTQSGYPTDGSDGSTESREEGLKRALGAALGSLNVLSKIYNEREARWREEMRRLTDDREHVEMLLKQTIGTGGASADTVGRAL